MRMKVIVNKTGSGELPSQIGWRAKTSSCLFASINSRDRLEISLLVSFSDAELHQTQYGTWCLLQLLRFWSVLFAV